MWKRIKRKFREFLKSELEKEIEKLEIKIAKIIEEKMAEMAIKAENEILKKIEEIQKRLNELTNRFR